MVSPRRAAGGGGEARLRPWAGAQLCLTLGDRRRCRHVFGLLTRLAPSFQRKEGRASQVSLCCGHAGETGQTPDPKLDELHIQLVLWWGFLGRPGQPPTFLQNDLREQRKGTAGVLLGLEWGQEQS